MVNVLPFYGNFYDAKRLYQALSKNICDTFWNNNHEAIWYAFKRTTKTTILYKDEFDDLFTNYVLKNEQAWNCELHVTLRVLPQDNGERLYKSFINFLNEVKSKQMSLKFHIIRFQKLPDNIELFETVIGLLYDLYLENYKKFIDLSDVWIKPEQKFEQPIYVSRLTNPENMDSIHGCDTFLLHLNS